MTRKVITIILLLTIAGGSFWVFSQFKKINEATPDAIAFIPANATTILQLNTDNWNVFYTQSSALSLLLNPEYHPLNNFLQSIDSLRSQREGIQTLLNNGQKYLVFFDNNPEGKNWIYTMGLRSDQNDEYFRNLFIETEFKEKHLGETIIHLHRKLNWAISNQVLLVSPNSDLIEANLSSIKSKQSVSQDSVFVKAFAAQGTNNIQIFSKKASEQFDLLPVAKASWTTYETRVKDHHLELYGIAFDTFTTTSAAAPTRLPVSILPQKKLTIAAKFFNNIDDELDKIAESRASQNEIGSYIDKLSAIENNCNCQAKTIAFNRTKSYGKFSNDHHAFVYVHYPNFDEAAEEFLPLIKESNSQEHQGFPIFELKYTNLYSLLLQQESLDHLKYFTFKDDYLIFAPKLEDLYWIIDQWRKELTLKNDGNFTSATKWMQTESNWVMYSQNTKPRLLVYPFWLKDTALTWEKAFDSNGVYNHVVVPTSAAVKMPATPAQATKTTSHNTASSTTILTENALKLKAEINGSPTIVTNHYTKEKEIFVQDKDNNIYLINNKGKELWSKKIDEKIQSPIRQIDVYRNGKLQLVFNTVNKIYCLDRNGKNVEGFPIKLKSKASSPLAVFDYDKKRKYRLVIGCEDKKIYNYTVEGKNTFGWKYKASDSPVIALEHLRIKGKDYIFTLLENDKISILKRTGTIKYQSPARATDYNHHGYALDIASKIEKTRMLYINSQGELIGLSLNQKEGEVLKTGFDKNAKLSYADVDGDKKSDILVNSQHTLKVYSSNLKEIFSKTYPAEILFAPNVYRLNSKDIRIGVNTQDGKFHLLDNQGDEISGYPKSATQPLKIVDLNKDGEKEVVVVKGNRVMIEGE